MAGQKYSSTQYIVTVRILQRVECLFRFVVVRSDVWHTARFTSRRRVAGCEEPEPEPSVASPRRVKCLVSARRAGLKNVT